MLPTPTRAPTRPMATRDSIGGGYDTAGDLSVGDIGGVDFGGGDF